MKWMEYFQENINTDIWGFILLDYYHHRREEGYHSNASQFINEVIENLPENEINPVAFHKVLVSVCVHLLGYDFPDIMKKSIAALKRIGKPLDEGQCESIILHYDVYGENEAFRRELEASDMLLHDKEEESKYNPAERPWWYSLGLPPTILSNEEEWKAWTKEIDLIIITATELELEAVMHFVKALPPKKKIRKVISGAETYYVGKFGTYKAVITKCRMGSIGEGSSMLATQAAQDLWHPRAIIMVGIAFGKDKTKQNIADVLVTSEIIPYEPQRVGNQKIERANIKSSSNTLLNRFENAQDWKFLRPDGTCCRIISGSVLSGEKLVDELEFKESLFKRYPGAIGGEMEGAGLCASSARLGLPWILVKSICDWADGKKNKEHQPLAAASAASLTHHILSQDTALDSL